MPKYRKICRMLFVCTLSLASDPRKIVLLDDDGQTHIFYGDAQREYSQGSMRILKNVFFSNRQRNSVLCAYLRHMHSHTHRVISTYQSCIVLSIRPSSAVAYAEEERMMSI